MFLVKQISLLAFILTAAVGAALAQSEKKVPTTVQKATVFLQGAQLFSTESMSLQAGITNVIFQGVSPYLVERSLQAAGKGGGDFVVMDVRYELKYTDVKPKTVAALGEADPNKLRYERELAVVADSLIELGFVQQTINYQKSNLAAERGVVVSNKLMRGEYRRDSLPLFAQSIDFLRTRLNNIDGEILKLDRAQYRLSAQVARLQKRQQELLQLMAGNYPKNPVTDAAPKPVSQVIVTVQCDAPTFVQLNVSYFVPNAGWAVSYDLRASKETANIDLRHKATVYQNTGVDWKDVLLTLSTGNPNVNNTKPMLSPFYINYNQSVAVYGYNNNNQLKNSTAGMADRKEEAKKASLDNNNDAAKIQEFDDKEVSDYVTINNGMLRVEYEIKLRYTIESDNKPHNVAIQNKSIPASYTYSVIPKMDLDAFLIARLTGWEDMNLIPGAARIYFDGSFVGETSINPNDTHDTLQLNLGRDKSIAVSRTKVKDKSKEQILTDNKVITKTYEIQVRNTKNIPIRIVIEDQIPVAQDNTIKIEKREDSNGEFNPQTGKLTWDIKLSSKSTKLLTFSYEVKYPKDKVLTKL